MVKEMMQPKTMSCPEGKVVRTAVICGIFFKNLEVPCHKCFRSFKESPGIYQQKQKFCEQTVFVTNSRAAELPRPRAKEHS